MHTMKIRTIAGTVLTAAILVVGCGDDSEELTPGEREFCEDWEAGRQDANETWAKKCYNAGYYNSNYKEYFDD